MKRAIYNILIIIYIIFAIAVTMCLLNFNEYNVTEFGSYSLIILTDNELNPDYNKGDLIIACNTDDVQVGEKAFMYNTYNNQMTIILAEVQDKEEVTTNETTYTIDGDYKISSEYYIGAQSTCVAIPKLGTILNIVESKWGFLFLIVMPSLIAFLYEIATVIADFVAENKEKEEIKEENTEE